MGGASIQWLRSAGVPPPPIVQTQPAQHAPGGDVIGHVDRAPRPDAGNSHRHVGGEHGSEERRHRPVGHTLRGVERIPRLGPGCPDDPGPKRDTAQQGDGRPVVPGEQQVRPVALADQRRGRCCRGRRGRRR